MKDVRSVNSDSDITPARDLPFVTVVMPVRNEAAFIRKSVGAVLSQEYPADKLELIVADGISDDGTRLILDELCEAHPNLKVLDNPGRIVPTGLNQAIRCARGDVVIRVDGHCDLDPAFVRESVQVLAEHPEAWSVGGPIVHAANGDMGRAIACAMSHPLGVGNALHRYPTYEGYVEGAQFPAFHSWIFERVGLFDETLVRNQDDEFNFRIGRAGGKIFVSPRIRYRYFVREELSRLFSQYFQYGFWRIPVIKKHQRPTTGRQVIPALFYFLIVLLFISGLTLGNIILAVTLPLLYLGVLSLAGLAAVRREGLAVGLRLPLAIAVIHAGYGFGMLYGMWSMLFNRDAWAATGRQAALTR